MSEKSKFVKFHPTKAHQRYVCSGGTIVPGGSTIAKVASAYEAEGPLMGWAWKQGRDGKDFRKVKDKAADAGLLAHWMVECYLKGLEPDLSDFAPAIVSQAENSYIKFMRWWDREGLILVASELQLVSERHLFGGTLDIVAAKPHGRPFLIDLKSSDGIRTSNWYQVAGYRKLWDEDHEPLEKVVIFRFGKSDDEKDWEAVPREDTRMDWVRFQSGLVLYHALKAKLGKCGDDGFLRIEQRMDDIVKELVA